MVSGVGHSRTASGSKSSRAILPWEQQGERPGDPQPALCRACSLSPELLKHGPPTVPGDSAPTFLTPKDTLIFPVTPFCAPSCVHLGPSEHLTASSLPCLSPHQGDRGGSQASLSFIPRVQSWHAGPTPRRRRMRCGTPSQTLGPEGPWDQSSSGTETRV